MGMTERVAARDAVSQILADAGINRETITQMLEEMIEKKVQERLDHIMRTKTDRIEGWVSERYDKVVEKVVTERFKQAFPYTNVTIEMKKGNN